MAVLAENATPLPFVSMTYALGETFSLPLSDQKTLDQGKVLSEIQVLLGGHVLEALVNGEDNVSTIYVFDLAHANKLARKAVDEWGMTDLGLVYVDDVRKISDKFKNDIETEVKAIIDKCTMIAHGLLENYKDKCVALHHDFEQ
ncbi:hypothetical protein niasHS_016191 [Heterodera schachtii]|uniref:Peptidase M41 domain-containing protein n=1 Tax=Heterodera schachtii TaxID=97005 RepID=A0ABD2HWZ3_HETSC